MTRSASDPQAGCGSLGEFDPFRSLLTVLTAAWIPVVLLIMLFGYVGIQFSSAISFRINDGWCDASEAVGTHCFGDYAMPAHLGGYSQFFDQGNPAATNTPLTLALFSALRLLPYWSGLAVVLAALLAANVLVLWWSTQGRNLQHRLMVQLFVGVGSLGILVALDRANWTPLLVPLIVALVLSRRSWIVVLAIALLVALKFWAPLFLVIPLARRQYRETLLGLVCAAGLYLVSYLTVTRDVAQAIAVNFASVTDRDYGDSVARYSVSLSATFRRMLCGAGLETFCPSPGQASNHQLVTLLSLAAAGGLVIAAWLVLRCSDWPLSLRTAPAIALGFLAVPEAAVYNVVVVSAIVALLAHERGPRWSEMDRRTRRTYVAILAGIAVATVPLPLSLPAPSGDLSRPVTVLIAVTWACVIVVAVASRPTGRSDGSSTDEPGDDADSPNSPVRQRADQF